MEQVVVPDYLYHYTNVDKLAMILNEKKFRFSNLRYLDDIEEGRTGDKQQYTKYCFVSSWTDEKDESIPMWKMYSEKMDGVRIRLPSNLFPNYDITAGSILAQFLQAGLVAPQNVKNKNGAENLVIAKSPVPSHEYFNEKYNFFPSVQGIELVKIDYSKEDDIVNPQLASVSDGQITVLLGKLGKVKREYWKFQKEWRYVFRVFPGSYVDLAGDFSGKKFAIINNYCPELPDSVKTAFFLKCDDKKFMDIEVTLGPKMNKGQRDIVRLLMDEYCPTAKMRESDLSDKVR